MENKGKVCVSIGKRPVDEIMGILDQVEMAEIRLDLASLNEDEVKAVFSGHDNLIATCREGVYDDMERARMLELAVEHGAAWIDVETDADPGWRHKMIKLAGSGNTGLILSKHFYSHTPSPVELRKEADNMFSMGAGIVKIACQVNRSSEAAALMGLYSEYENIVVIGMGPLGVITRLAAPFLGAPFTFASFGDKQLTASGQIDYHEMSGMLEKISSYG